MTTCVYLQRYTLTSSYDEIKIEHEASEQRRTRRGGGGRGSNTHIRVKINSCNIRAKPLEFRANNGESIRATDLSPTPPPAPNVTGPVRLCDRACASSTFRHVCNKSVIPQSIESKSGCKSCSFNKIFENFFFYDAPCESHNKDYWGQDALL